MADSEVLGALETLAAALDIDVRYESGDFRGGLCSVDHKHQIILKKSESDEHKIDVLIRELSAFDIENIYIIPALRDLLARGTESIPSQED
jgi:hypothetical protein